MLGLLMTTLMMPTASAFAEPTSVVSLPGPQFLFSIGVVRDNNQTTLTIVNDVERISTVCTRYSSP